MRGLLLWVGVAFAVAGCAPNFSAARHQARLDHACESAEAVWWDKDADGVWVRSCGSFRYYVEIGGRWVEDRTRAYAEAGGMPSSPDGCPIYDGLVQCGGPTSAPSASGSGGPVRVRGYYRRDGTYVPGHTRRAPRRR